VTTPVNGELVAAGTAALKGLAGSSWERAHRLLHWHIKKGILQVGMAGRSQQAICNRC
jgi:hypothetical protein